MTQKDKTLNCLNCRIGDFKQSLCDCDNGFCAKYKGIGTEKDFFKAIEALSERTGEWVVHEWAEECDGLLISNYECTNCHSWERNNTDFCPNCGADMRGNKE